MLMSGLTGMPLANVVFSFMESDFVGKLIVVVLFVGSMYIWCVMLGKALEFSAARKKNLAFRDGYRRKRPPVGLLVAGQKFDGSPLYGVYEAACSELVGRLESGPADTATPDKLPPLGDRDFDVVRGQAERAVSEQMLQLEHNMVMLATATSVAPFLGLLGTVLGVMSAFGGMAVGGSAMLSAVAPGIAGALLTTVVGLVVALPSAIGYNILGERLRELEVGLESFVEEFTADVSAACADVGGR